MIKDKSLFYKKFSFSFFAAILIILLFANVTLAYFADSASVNTPSVITMGKVDIGANVYSKSSSNWVVVTSSDDIISAQELVPGKSDVYKVLQITTPNDAVASYVRISYVFKINNVDCTTSYTLNAVVHNERLVSMQIADTSKTDYFSYYASSGIDEHDYNYWTMDNSNTYIYYNNMVETNTTMYIPLQFSISANLGTDIINSYPCTVQVIVEAIQEANDAREDVWSTAPANWLNYSNVLKTLPSCYTQQEYVDILNDATNSYNNNFNTQIAFKDVNKIVYDLQCVGDSNKNAIIITDALRSGDCAFIATKTTRALSSVSFDGGGSTPSYDYTQRNNITVTYTSSATYNIAVGSWQDSTWSTSYRWYGVKLYNGTTIVAEFVPVQLNASLTQNAVTYPSGTYGFYDIVNDVFCANTGSGSFTGSALITA